MQTYAFGQTNIAIQRATPLAWLKTPFLAANCSHPLLYLFHLLIHTTVQMKGTKRTREENAGMLMNAEVSGGQGKGKERGGGTIHTHGSS